MKAKRVKDVSSRSSSKTKKRVNRRKVSTKEVFWVTIVVMFILSVLAITFSLDSPTGNSVQTIAFIDSGSLTFEVKDVPGVKSAVIHFSDSVKNGKILFELDDSIPFKGNSYRKFKISSSDQDKILKVDLSLKIKEDDLLAVGIATSDVRIFVNGKEFATTFDKRVDNYFFYSATTNILGDYVIGRTKVVPVQEEETVIQKAPEEVIVPKPAPKQEVEPVVQEPAPVKKSVWSKIKKFFNTFNASGFFR